MAVMVLQDRTAAAHSHNQAVLLCLLRSVAVPPMQAELADDDDDDDRPVAAAAAAPAPPSAAASAPSTAAAVTAAAAARLPQTPRLRTRLFAAELLLSLFSAVGPDPRHKFPKPKYDEGAAAGSAAAAGNAGDTSIDAQGEKAACSRLLWCCCCTLAWAQ